MSDRSNRGTNWALCSCVFLFCFILVVTKTVQSVDVNADTAALSNGLATLPVTDNVSSDLLTDQGSSSDNVLDNSIMRMVIIIQLCGINSFVGIFGIATNIINIVVFVKQGFEDSMNISLFGLAIADTGSLIFLLWSSICLSPMMQESGLPIVVDDIMYITAGWPRTAFTRVIAWITAFITFERCLCVTIPLKVKIIITPTRTRIIVVIIFVVLMGTVIPNYYTSRLARFFSAERNQTIYGLQFTDDREEVDRIAFIICSVLLPMGAFITVVICTIILIFKLKSKAKWREQSVAITDRVSQKDKKIAKLVTFISTIFIVSFFPNVLLFTAMAVSPEFNFGGKYIDLLIVVAGYILFAESINSSVNFFLYVKMSSRFKNTLKALFCGQENEHV